MDTQKAATFCERIEQDEQSRQRAYHILESATGWYKHVQKRYSERLRAEVGWHMLSGEIQSIEGKEDVVSQFLRDLPYQFEVHLAKFCVAEALTKLVLCKYSAGPDPAFCKKHGLILKYNKGGKYDNKSWFDCDFNAPAMNEMLAKVLADEEERIPFDLNALMADRAIRNKETHASEAGECLSAIRALNAIRDTFVFLDSGIGDRLPPIPLSKPFNYDQFLSEPCAFNFHDYVPILVAGSVRDVRNDYLATVANLP